jgi:hypothetical protein
VRDSILTGSINRVEVLYTLVIGNYDRIAVAAKEMADDFIDLKRELAAEGCAVQVRTEASSGRSKRSRIQQHRPDELEAELDRSLISALKECASGRWGLFGQNERLDRGGYLRWGQALHVRQRAAQIHALREEFGQPNPLVERFLYYCWLRGANVPGEPKLARVLLDKIESDSTARQLSVVSRN